MSRCSPKVVFEFAAQPWSQLRSAQLENIDTTSLVDAVHLACMYGRVVYCGNSSLW